MESNQYSILRNNYCLKLCKITFDSKPIFVVLLNDNKLLLPPLTGNFRINIQNCLDSITVNRGGSLGRQMMVIKWLPTQSNIYNNLGFLRSMYDEENGGGYKSSDEKSIYWFTNGSDSGQFNDANIEYWYIAFLE